MSISQDNGTTVVYKEVFDDSSHPSNEEVIEYAKRLGIDLDTEPHLLDIAREGLMAPLPKGWAPALDSVRNSWYYYQASTKTATWEHPLDPYYKEIVAQARSGNKRLSLGDEDSKTTAKDLESHEEATLSKDLTIPKSTSTPSKIPGKLVPLKKIGYKKRERSSRKDREPKDTTKSGNPVAPLNLDRASRDYTKLAYQDPDFYKCPKLLETDDGGGASTCPTGGMASSSSSPSIRKDINLKLVLKRSESFSPRHEKDWEQLSSRFNSEENIIDIDKFGTSTLNARFERNDKFEQEKHPNQLGHQKELTISGGGSMFLKSGRSKDITSKHDGATKPEESRILSDTEETAGNIGEDKLKSILREKPFEDEDRPLEEERKSVRFDLQRDSNDFNSAYLGSEDSSESGSEEEPPKLSFFHQIQETFQSNNITKNSNDQNDSSGVMSDSTSKLSKLVAKRFLVSNISEREHFNQLAKEDSKTDEQEDSPQPITFADVKNIDLVSKNTEIKVNQSQKSSNWDKLMKTSRETSKNQYSNDDIAQTNHVQSQFQRNQSPEDVKAIFNEEYIERIEALKEEFQLVLNNTNVELEKEFVEQRLKLQHNLKNKLDELKLEMLHEEQQEVQKLIGEMDEIKLKNLDKVRAELEICYEKEKQEILANLGTELDQRKKELIELRNQEMGKLESEYTRDLDESKLTKLGEYELNKQHHGKIEVMKVELEKEYQDARNDIRLQQREKIAKITEEHEKCLAEILRDFKTDEDLARKMYKQRLDEIRADYAHNLEKEEKKQTERVLQQNNLDFEKMRCEKRLLQDKYVALKEKYIKLKNDVRLAVERRTKRREGYTTASETERSASTRTRTEKTESSDQNTPLTKASSYSLTKQQSDPQHNILNEQYSNQAGEESDNSKSTLGYQKKANVGSSPHGIGTKFESDDTTTASETNPNLMVMRKKRIKRAGGYSTKQNVPGTSALAANNDNNNLENSVEIIRKQLEKLEDLGDQLPSNETAYTLRYPFQDKAPLNASSELEFFRHRIHVEKDSVRRDRDALRQRKDIFEGRQRAWKQRSPRATLEQLVQEERELSDMEVNLHRTRSLLSEKVIHLRHLEQSLERVAKAKDNKNNENDASSTKNDETTLSDMSSASSGFSSTDLGTDNLIDKRDHYQESTEIIASLENLNSEIREIWGVLNKRQDSNVPSPPTLMYSYLRWLRLNHFMTPTNSTQGFGIPNIQSNILSQLTATQNPPPTTQNIIAQYGPHSGFTTSVGPVERNTSNLLERSRNLKDWLRPIRIENTDLVNPGQATL